MGSNTPPRHPAVIAWVALGFVVATGLPGCVTEVADLGASPAFDQTRVVVYVRGASNPGGSPGDDTTGDGSLDRPFLTMRRALSTIPLDVVTGRYVVDCTDRGVDEVGPDGLVLPPLRSSAGLVRMPDPLPHPGFGFEGTLTLRATPYVELELAAADLVAQVADPVDGLVTITVTGRSWATDQWKGKLIVGAGRGQHAVIAGNTATTLELTASAGFTPPVRIESPSCELRNGAGTASSSTLIARGLTGSLVLAGLRVSHGHPNATAFIYHADAIGRFLASDFDGVSVVASAPYFGGCRFQGAAPLPAWPRKGAGRQVRRSSGAYSALDSLFQDVEFFAGGTGALVGTTQIAGSVVDGCAYLGEHYEEGSTGGWLLEGVRIKRARTHGFAPAPGSPNWVLGVSIADSAGDAIHVDGAGPVDIVRAQGAGNQRYGIRAINGAQVSVDGRTTVAGALGELRVGGRAPRSYLHFRSEPAAYHEVDLTPETGDTSRVWQDGTCCGVWSHWSAGASHEFASPHAASLDPSGNLIAVGRSASAVLTFPGAAPLPSLGGYDGFVVKRSPTGAALWAQRLGGPGNDLATAVATDAAGNLVVVGNYQGAVSLGGAPLPVVGGYEAFVLKLDPQGHHLWSVGLATPGHDTGYAVAIDPAGEVVVTGATDWNPYGTTGDVFLVKLAGATGAVLWTKPLVDVGGAAGFDVATSATGDVVLVGSFGNPSGGAIDLGGVTLSSPGVRRGFVARLSGATGAHVWSQAIDHSNQSDLNAVAVVGDAVFVGGAARGPATLAGGPPVTVGGEYDFFLARLALATGAHAWSQAFGGAGTELALDLTVDGDGAVIAAGALGSANVSFGGPRLGFAPSPSDVVVARYDGATGGHLDSRSFGSSGDDVAYGVVVRPETRNVLLVGHSSATLDLGDAWHGDPLGLYGVFVANLGRLEPPPL